MRQFFKILFACLCALILFIFIAFVSLTGIVAGLSSGDDKVSVEEKTILTIDLNEEFQEQGKDNILGAISGDETQITGLNEIIRSIQESAKDDHIEGIYIKTGMCNNGWATLKEIKDALIEFKKSKKFVVSYGEVSDQKSYYLASVGDQVYLNPSGMIEFKGLSITGTFYKGALDKLDVTSEAFHCGKFKGAYEPFKLEKFSDPNRYQLSVLLQDMYGEFLSTVSAKTSLDTATLAKMANNGSIRFPQDALQYKFIDGLVYGDSVESILKKKLGLSAKDKIKFIGSSEYASTFSESFNEKNKIAVLYAAGEIHDGEGRDGIYSKTFIKNIRKIAADDNIKAVVLRVNSPGGSALASEIIYHEMMQLKKKKPVVISMGNYAASGGYYISCAGDSIFADNNTLTGSIGVVGVMFNIENMMKNKLGVTFDHVKTGEYADFPNMSRKMTDIERAWIQSYLDSIYTLFKTRVAVARNLSMEQVEELAQGHVYSGKLAKELKLIDAFGNKDRAILAAASMAKIKDYRLVEYPKPMNQIDEIMATLSGGKGEEAITKKILGEDYKIYKEIQKVRAQQNQIQAILPYQIEIR
ncbi:MAG: signal peptide peptidase SppA [Bacteroidetes bacterium]|nr:signal peptide peptidase SppA [Bacteroidota bacterium]